jgi:hypothetical protein
MISVELSWHEYSALQIARYVFPMRKLQNFFVIDLSPERALLAHNHVFSNVPINFHDNKIIDLYKL